MPRYRGATNPSAESKRFELLIPFRVYTLSRRAPSTTRTTLRIIFQIQQNQFVTFQIASPTLSLLHPRPQAVPPKSARSQTGIPTLPRGGKNTISPPTFRIIFPHSPS